MSCNLLNCGSGDCGINIVWVIILFWLLFFNTGSCSCGCGSSPSYTANNYCGC